MAARSDAPEARRALGDLCRIYRPVVHGYVCRHGYHSNEADDLTQAFFERLLIQRPDVSADPLRGRFRVFLQTTIKHFLLNQRTRELAAKRGGGQTTVSLETMMEVGSQPADADTPELAFERAWGNAVVNEAISRLAREALEAGKEGLFRALRPFLLEPPDPDEYGRIATALSMRRNTLAVAIHRLRQRLRELVKDELAETVTETAELEAEIQTLHAVLALNDQGETAAANN